MLGLWITTFLDWDKNTREMCKNAYARVTMLTKLKYVGIPEDDLIDVYNLYIRSVLEYCSVVWHSTLTIDQSTRIENVQKLCMKIILGTEYRNYDDSLIRCGLERLSQRREARCLKFGLKSLLHPVHSKLFPVNPHVRSQAYESSNREHFTVNMAKTDSYKDSAVPYIQRILNAHVKSQRQ